MQSIQFIGNPPSIANHQPMLMFNAVLLYIICEFDISQKQAMNVDNFIAEAAHLNGNFSSSRQKTTIDYKL